MTIPMGPHQRRGRRRRRGKALVLCVVLAALAAVSSWTKGPPRGTLVAWGEEEPRAVRGLQLAADHDPAKASDDEDKPEPERARLEPSALGWMINRSAYSPGEARAFADQYPELADLFLNAEPLPVQ